MLLQYVLVFAICAVICAMGYIGLRFVGRSRHEARHDLAYVVVVATSWTIVQMLLHLPQLLTLILISITGLIIGSRRSGFFR